MSELDWTSIPPSDCVLLREGFANYSKYGDKNSNGDSMALRNADKWLKESHLMGRSISTTDTSIAFKQVVG